MTSPCKTPERDLSSDGDEWCYKRVPDCEWVDEYRPGGFHPVHLGDTFNNGRYMAIRKLGEGSYSTVWLVVSTGIQVPRYAALKIVTANSTTVTTELTILEHLSQSAADDPDAEHIIKFLDKFQHQGPNGIHQCLVFELMGASTASLVEELPENNQEMWDGSQRYPKAMAKKILLQSLQGLLFLHKNGVVHGDVQPGNLLFSIEDLDGVEPRELEQDEAKTAVPVQGVEGIAESTSLPRNMYLRQMLHDRVKLGQDFCAKLSDFGAAFFTSDPPAFTVTPAGLRSPELILKQSFDSSIDIWSLGCLMYEFLTGEPLFAVMMSGDDPKDQEKADDDHLVQIHEKIQPLPESILRIWPGAEKWYNPDPEQPCPGGDFEPYEPLEQRFANSKPADIDDDEAAVVCKLIREMLAYEPAERPSAAELLKHPWFSE